MQTLPPFYLPTIYNSIFYNFCYKLQIKVTFFSLTIVNVDQVALYSLTNMLRLELFMLKDPVLSGKLKDCKKP